MKMSLIDMFRVKALLIILAFFPFLPNSSNAQDSVDELGWLAGCWQRKTSNLVSEEYWMKPSANSMLGMNRTIRKGTMIEYEYLRITQDSLGSIWYVAAPSGQKETAFQLTKSTDGEFVFENPAHDFPQTIAYRSIGSDSLVARIAGKIGGKEKQMIFPMKRKKCE